MPEKLAAEEQSSVAVAALTAAHDAGLVHGLYGGDVVLTLAMDISADSIELKFGGQSLLGSVGAEEPGDPLLSANQLLNADFTDGLKHWQLLSPPDAGQQGLDQVGWHLLGGHTAFLRQDAQNRQLPLEVVYRSEQPDGLIPLRSGASYQFAGLFAAHRCSAKVMVRIITADGTILGEASGRPRADALGGAESAGYDHVVVNIVAPPEPCSAQIIFHKECNSAQVDSWLFYTRLWFGRVTDRKPVTFGRAPFPATDLAVLQRLDVRGIRQFRVPLPSALARRTVLEVSERASGRPLHGSPLEVGYTPHLVGGITGLDGTTVIGWAQDADHPDNKLTVRLFVDDREHGTVLAHQPHGEGWAGFRLPLPVAVLDGRAHHIAVRLLTDQLVGEIAALLPSQLTPWSALARYGGPRLPAVLSPAAAFRYEALRAHALAVDQVLVADPEREAAQQLVTSQLGVVHERLLIGLDRSPKLAPLAFPVYAKPKVSVVIPVHNKFDVTHNCLAALLLAYNHATFEVIIADDGSSDATRNVTKLVSGITYCRNETAEGFVSSCNLGASKARGEYIILLNNDTEPTLHWLDEMLHAFENFDKVGLVGSKLIYPDGRLQEAGGIVWGDGSPWNYGRLGNASDPRYCYSRQVDYLSGASIMIPRTLWTALGGLSEEFRPAYYEDTDLAFKVRDAGYRTVYAAQSVVFHFEGISSGTSTASGMKRFQEVNRPKFLRKWRSAYRHHGLDTSKAHLEKDRGVYFRALFVDAQTPRPDNDAGSYAAVQEMRAMQALGAKVTFLPENLAYLGNYTTDLQRAGIETVYAPFAYSVEDFLRERGDEFDVIYITRYMVAERHLETVRRLAPRAKVLFCNADLHFLRELREAILARSPDKITAALDTRDTELRVMRNVDVTLSYNTVEHAVIMSHNFNSTAVTMAPWIVDVADQVPGFEARADVAFLGGFGHPPNAEAVTHFIREVMPLLRRRVPGVRFLVYGSGMTAELEALACEDVVMKGFVQDLKDVYHTCRVFVAPLLSGAGVKGKVVDALSFGMPSVLSPVAVEGIGLGDGVHTLVAQTPEEWAEAVASLYTDAKRWQSISDQALAFARKTYSFERGAAHMRTAVEMAGLFPETGMTTRRARLGL